MNRKFKTLGLALVAVFAMSAVVASAAQAGEIQWEAGATQLTASAASSQVFNTTAGEITCNEISGEVNLPEGTSAETLTTSNLKYDNNETGRCASNISGFEPKIEMKGCNYRFHGGETIGGESEIAVTTDVVCPEGAAITINGGFVCTVKVGAQEGLTGLVAKTEGSGLVLVAGVENIKYSHSGLCGNGSGTTGKYTGNTNVAADSGNVSTK